MASERLQLEARVLEILEAVESGRQVEDTTFVELKREWPVPDEAARLIAAHANAARGAPILWLIGVDEKAGSVPGTSRQELAQWWDQVVAGFDDVAPTESDLVVHFKGGASVVAITFDTSSGPFVVKTGNEKVSRELPWREGTRVRSAQRRDLVRMLAPMVGVPNFEVVSALLTWLERSEPDARPWRWFFQADTYVTPKDEGRVVFPFHRSDVRCQLTSGSKTHEVVFSTPSFGPVEALRATRGAGASYTVESLSRTVDWTDHEALVTGPGMMRVFASASTDGFQVTHDESVSAAITLQPAASDLSAVLHVLLPAGEREGNEVARWELPG